MAFTLYNAPQSTCSQRVRFVLNAKKLAFDEVKLNLLAGDQFKPNYLKLNPNGVLPTLDHDGAIVIDSTVIAEYLDEVAPADSFTPEQPVARARMRALMHFIDEMPAAAVRALVRMNDLGQAAQWQDLARVKTWFDTIRAQPAFRPTFYPGSLLSERFPHLKETSAASA